MKPRQPAAIVLALFAALLVGWFLIRSHTHEPDRRSTAASASVNHPSASLPPTAPGPASTSTTVPVVSAIPASANTSSAGSQKPTPRGSAAPAQPFPATPAVIDPDTARADAASINALKVRRMITDFHTLNGENPVGTNAEIMAAIMGKNSRQAILGPPEGLGLNGKGELIDDWGTPYFFHQLSKDVMEIHSAGPDRIMGTADDIVVR